MKNIPSKSLNPVETNPVTLLWTKSRKLLKCVENEGHGKETGSAPRPSDGCARQARGPRAAPSSPPTRRELGAQRPAAGRGRAVCVLGAGGMGVGDSRSSSSLRKSLWVHDQHPLQGPTFRWPAEVDQDFPGAASGSRTDDRGLGPNWPGKDQASCPDLARVFNSGAKQSTGRLAGVPACSVLFRGRFPRVSSSSGAAKSCTCFRQER